MLTSQYVLNVLIGSTAKQQNAACSHYKQMCGIFKIFTASGTHQKRKPASQSRAEDVQQKLV